MVDRPDRRELHLLIAHRSQAAVVTETAGSLPTVTIELTGDDSTVVAAKRAVSGLLGLDRPILEIFFDFEVDHDDTVSGADAVPVLTVFETPPEDWPVPAGHVWRSLTEPDPETAPGLRGRLAELLAELRHTVDPPPLRPRWSRPGWYSRASSWIEEQLAMVDRRQTGPIEQVRHWGISALLRVDTESGGVWFKAVFPSFGHEPAVTSMLHGDVPGWVAPVIAVDEQEGWMLLDDIGSDVIARRSTGDVDEAAVRRLVAIQRRFVDRTQTLEAAGCPRRDFDRLADQLALVLRDPEVLEWIEVGPGRVDEIVGWTANAAREVARLPFPDTLVHGDFHPGNVAVVDGRPVIFDWSDAAIAHPLIDALTWLAWWRDEPQRVEPVWDTFVASWADVCPVDLVRPIRADLEGLAAGYHTVSYAGIVKGLEPRRRPEMAEGVQLYFNQLDAAVPH